MESANWQRHFSMSSHDRRAVSISSQATSFFMINDEGIWLLRHPKGKEAAAELKDLPPCWSD